MDVKFYVVGEFMADILAIADKLKGLGHPFHLMGTSIGSMIAWHLAAEYPERVLSLACINIPCLLYTSPSPRDLSTSRMPSSA